MLNGGTLIDAVLRVLRDIPEFVIEMASAEERIIGFYGRFPDQASRKAALLALPRPSVLVLYNGFGPGQRGGEVWKHRLSVWILPRQTLEADAPEAHYKALWLLVNGIPNAAGTIRLLNYEIHPACDPMDVPEAEVQTIALDDFGATLDYWEFNFALTEKGDA